MGVGCTIGILTVEGKENGVELFVSVKKHFENDWNKIYKKIQLDDLSMGLAGGVAFILVFLLIFLPLADFKVAKEGSSNNCYGKYTTKLTHHNDTCIGDFKSLIWYKKNSWKELGYLQLIFYATFLVLCIIAAL